MTAAASRGLKRAPHPCGMRRTTEGPSDALEDDGQALPPADAQAHERVSASTALQLSSGSERETRTGGAQRVSHGDGAAVRIDATIVRCDAESFQARQDLGCEGFV